MHYNPLEQRLIDIIEPVAADLGFRLVHLSMNNETLQVMAENPETKNLNIDECAKLSREISAVLDVEDPISGRYMLEVGSPGIDRPLMNAQDFVDYNGFEAKIEIDPPLEGQKRFRGFIMDMEDDDVVLKTDQGEVAFPLNSVHKAKLVLTDSLINAAKQKKKA